MIYFWHGWREVWPCNREEMSNIQDTTKLFCRGHFRSFNHSLLSVKCLFKTALFLTKLKSSFPCFCSKTAQGRQNFFPCCPYLDSFRCFCLHGKFRHLKLDFFSLYLMWFHCRQIVYSSLLMSHLYLASDFNPFLLTPDRLFCSWGGAWAAVCANDVTAASWLAHLKDNTLFFQHDKDSTIPCSWLDIKPVFFQSHC